MNGARASAVFAALLLAACATTPSSLPAASPAPTPSAGLPRASPTTSPTTSPTETPLPAALEGWSVLNGPAVEIEGGPDGVTVTLIRRALWFQDQRAVLIWMPVTGNFVITADVATSRASDPSQPPGADGRVELAGVMARADGIRENYVFIVVGSDADGLSVETKSTTDNASVFDGPAWDSGSASLMLCRNESTFLLAKRPIASDQPWIPATAYERSDMPATLQVGLNIYSDSTPDLRAVFTNFEIRPLPAEGCPES
ncbi:MAG TPA: hypothetical protein VFC71_04675 [Candidatus Polarisedimenticolia bacterium]|nr:hypothetical protein [Candidatus Polarisedimenticolia bacterium]